MLAALGAGLGALQSIEKHKQMRKQNKLAALQTQLSPWTKMGAGQTQEGPGLAGGLAATAQGAMGGMGAQKKFDDGGGFSGMMSGGKK